MIAVAETVLLNPQTLQFLLQAATDAAQIAMDYSSGNITAEQAHINLINAGHRQREAITDFNNQVGYYTPGPSSEALGISSPPPPKNPIEAGSPPPTVAASDTSRGWQPPGVVPSGAKPEAKEKG